MKAVLKILGVILIGMGVIILLAGKSAATDALGLIVLLLMGGIPAALGVLCLLKSGNKKKSGSNVPEQPSIPPMPEPEPVKVPEPVSAPEPDLINDEPPAPAPEQDPYQYYSFKVAGISFHEKEIIDGLASENDDYDMTKKEIVDAYMTDESIYKYTFSIDDVQLEPEPDNPHDPNAIKVIVDGVFIGHVPAKSTKRVKQILSKSPEIMCEVYGGPSKIVFDEGDGTYTMKKSDHNFGAEVILKYM